MWTTHPFNPPNTSDKLREECGVFGIYGDPDAAHFSAFGLHALQHRGQEAVGIVSFDDDRFHSKRAEGLVEETFGGKEAVAWLKGSSAIGHVRYSTTGDTVFRNIQPLFADIDGGGLAVAHNGNLTNARQIRRQLEARGSIFQSTTDTEVIVHLIATSEQKDFIDRMTDALQQIKGAYSLVMLTNSALIGARDPFAVRPLVLGRKGSAYVLASETCAFDIIGATYIRDIEPGEVVVINKEGLTSHKPFARSIQRSCVFEYIYFARPDSVVDGAGVYESRKRIGEELADESNIDADVVVPVPDSGVPAAMGYADRAKLRFELGIIRNHYVGRTFIQPSQDIRHFGVKMKHNANAAVIHGKRVVLVDDSIVRGTTSKKIVEMVREAGATEVHMRIASPPTKHSCFYGVDTPSPDQLLASGMTVEQMARHIGADSLQFVSIDGLYRAMGRSSRDPDSPQYCDACFSGDYPIDRPDATGDSPAQLSFLS